MNIKVLEEEIGDGPERRSERLNTREEIGEVPERRSERLNKYIGISSSLRVAMVFSLAV